MRKSNTSFIEFIGYVVLFILIAVAEMAARGYAFSSYWNWFLVPSFASANINIPPLTMVYAWGILGTLSFLKTPNFKYDDSIPTKDIVQNALKKGFNTSLGYMLVAGIGYLVHSFA